MTESTTRLLGGSTAGTTAPATLTAAKHIGSEILLHCDALRALKKRVSRADGRDGR